ncbi:MAG: ChaB family protein [Chloroflexi bacterium]|nr:ChaB family protein [Chloroflexota bacterium]
MARNGSLKERSRQTGIPQTILRSEEHAQHIWKQAHDHAVQTYGEGRSAHRVAYAALKHEYEKRGDRWVRKAHPGPSDPQAARGPTTRPRSTEEPAAPTARGKVAQTEQEARARAREAQREYAAARRRE